MTTRRPGRPRSTEVDDAILDAALQLIAERGLRETTTEAIAAKAHAGKDTIYRRWRHKDALAEAVLERVAATRPAIPDTGVLRDDLGAYLDALEARLADPVVGRFLAVAVGEAPHHAGFRRLLRHHRAGVEHDVTAILRAGTDDARAPAIHLAARLIVSTVYADRLLGSGSDRTLPRSELLEPVLRSFVRSSS